MSSRFTTVDYAATLDESVRLGDCLPPDHLARFVVDTIGRAPNGKVDYKRLRSEAIDRVS